MANVLNRTTKDYLRSVNTPDYPVQDWIINPDISAVEGWENRYWVITGDAVTLMDAAARATLDAQTLSDARDNIVDQLDQVEDVLRAFAKAVVGEINILRQQFNDTTAEVSQLTTTTFNPRTMAQLKTSIRNELGS